MDVNNVVCISDGVLNSDPGSKTLSAHPALHHVAKALQDITQNSSTTMAHLLELAAGDIDPERCNPTAYDHYCAVRSSMSIQSLHRISYLSMNKCRYGRSYRQA